MIPSLPPLLVLAWDEAVPPTLALVQALAARQALLALLPHLPEGLRTAAELAAARHAAEANATRAALPPARPRQRKNATNQPADLKDSALYPRPGETAGGVWLLGKAGGQQSRIVGLAEVGLAAGESCASDKQALTLGAAPVFTGPLAWAGAHRTAGPGAVPAAPYAGREAAPPYSKLIAEGMLLENTGHEHDWLAELVGSPAAADTEAHADHLAPAPDETKASAAAEASTGATGTTTAATAGPAVADGLIVPSPPASAKPPLPAVPPLIAVEPDLKVDLPFDPDPELPPYAGEPAAGEAADLDEELTADDFPAPADTAPDWPAVASGAGATLAGAQAALLPPLSSMGETSGDLQFRIIQYARFAMHLATGPDEQFGAIYAPDWPTWLAALEIRYRTRRPLVLHLHELAIDTAAPDARGWRLELERYALRRAQRVLVTTEELRCRVLAHYPVPPQRLRVVAADDEARIGQELADVAAAV